MTLIEKSIKINAPPEKVWEMLAWDNTPKWEALWTSVWLSNLKSVDYTSEVRTPEDKYRVGASARITTKRGEYDFKITESLENEKITFRSPYCNLCNQYILEPLAEGTKFTYVLDYEMPWGILGKILNKLYAQRAGRKEMERSLEKLKSILEK